MKGDTMSSNKRGTKVEAEERSETSISRRDVIKATAGSATVVAVTAVVTGQEQTTTYELGGATRGWEGEAPQSISGETNPTLTLKSGAKYEITWENLDGQPHNVVIIDGNSNQLVRSEIINEGSQTVEFTASDEMSEYFCEVHPTSMRGSIEITTNNSGNATTGSENTSNGSEVQVSKPSANVSDPKGSGNWQPYDEDSEEAADKYVDNSTIITNSENGTESEIGMENVETATETSDNTDTENETESDHGTTSENGDDGTKVSSGGNGKAKSGNGKAKTGSGNQMG